MRINNKVKILLFALSISIIASAENNTRIEKEERQ